MTRRESAAWAIHRPAAALVRAWLRVLDRINRDVCALSNRIGDHQ